MFCCLDDSFKPNKIVYYQEVVVGQHFASSETGEVYVKNTEDLYEEDFSPKDLVYIRE